MKSLSNQKISSIEESVIIKERNFNTQNVNKLDYKQLEFCQELSEYMTDKKTKEYQTAINDIAGHH